MVTQKLTNIFMCAKGVKKVHKCVTVVVGTKWGDEGKGKVASAESNDATLVMRATGGNNAGHTVVYNGQKLSLHLVPGGIVYPQTTCIIGPGVVIDPLILQDEISVLESMGVPNISSRLKISGRAHAIFPYHKDLDKLHEKLKNNPIGTTGRGIGPCYSDKSNRTGIRVYDLLLPKEKLEQKITEVTQLHYQLLRENGFSKNLLEPYLLTNAYHVCGEELKQFICNVDPIIAKAIEGNQKIVVEGAQAFRLDLDHGDYPMVTSSNPVTAGTLCGAALPPQALKEVIGVDKAYNSRVGNGPFPTEQGTSDPQISNVASTSKEFIGDIIRELGHEYGTTTGRPRRCGWMDAVILRSAKHTCGIDYLCINHLDTLGKIGLKVGEVKICVGYIYQDKSIDYFPDDISLTGEIPTPCYYTIEGGWEIPKSCKTYKELPKKAKEFIKIVEEVSGIPVKYIGIGPSNDDLIIRNNL